MNCGRAQVEFTRWESNNIWLFGCYWLLTITLLHFVSIVDRQPNNNNNIHAWPIWMPNAVRPQSHTVFRSQFTSKWIIALISMQRKCMAWFSIRNLVRKTQSPTIWCEHQNVFDPQSISMNSIRFDANWVCFFHSMQCVLSVCINNNAYASSSFLFCDRTHVRWIRII